MREIINNFGFGNVFVVTSRPHGISDWWLHVNTWHEAELLPMELRDINAFIYHWHRSVSLQYEDNERKEKLNALINNLKDVIRQNYSIRSLATNPLLCSMLCAMHHDRNQQIPRDRIELYDACCEMLIERRDIERGVPHEDYPILSYRQKRQILSNLAYYLTKNGWSTTTVQKARQRIKGRLPFSADISEQVKAKDVLRLLIDRTGIVRQLDNQSVDFAHKTFQEFLSAEAILYEGDIGLLLKNAGDHLWREVIALACGLANRKERYDIITGLLKLGDESDKSEKATEYHTLAIAGAEISTELPEDLRNKISDRIKQLIPPKNSSEARSLAGAGDFVVPHLLEKKDDELKVMLPCLEALAYISSNKALDAIEQFASRREVEILAMLLRIWLSDRFDRDIFGQKILSKLSINKLRPRVLGMHIPIESLEGIHYLSKLKELDLQGTQVSDLTPLSQLTSLTILNLRKTGVVDLSPLRELTNLTHLYAFDTKITDLSPLAGLDKLKHLDVRFTNVKDYSCISHLSSLTELLKL